MSDFTDFDLLLAYLGDELSDDEVRALAARLKSEPELADQLVLLARKLNGVFGQCQQDGLVRIYGSIISLPKIEHFLKNIIPLSKKQLYFLSIGW